MKYIKLILLVFSLLLLPWAGNEAWAKDAEITDLRWTARNDGDPPFVRIVTDLTKAVQAEAAIDKSGKNFEVILKNTQKSFSGSQYDMDPRAIDFATVSEKDGDTYIDVALTAGAAGCLTARTPETLLPGKAYVQVADTRLALAALAACQWGGLL